MVAQLARGAARSPRRGGGPPVRLILRALTRMRGRGCGGSALSDTTREYTREGAGFLRAELPAILAKRSDVLSPCMLRIVEDLAGKWRHLDEPIEGVSSEIAALVDQNAACKRLMIVPGIGPIISSAIVAAIGAGDMFSSKGPRLVAKNGNPSLSEDPAQREPADL